jgi:hypothetical protein
MIEECKQDIENMSRECFQMDLDKVRTFFSPFNFIVVLDAMYLDATRDYSSYSVPEIYRRGNR